MIKEKGKTALLIENNMKQLLDTFLISQIFLANERQFSKEIDSQEIYPQIYSHSLTID